LSSFPINAHWTKVGDFDGEAAGDQCGVASLNSDDPVLAAGYRLSDGNGTCLLTSEITFQRSIEIWESVSNSIYFNIFGGMFDKTLNR